MSQISRITTWASGQQPTAPALNGEFDNFISTWNQTDYGASTWGQVKSTSSSLVPLIANATGTQNIANFQSSGSTVSSISNLGLFSNQFGTCRGTSYVGGASNIHSFSTISLLNVTNLTGTLVFPANYFIVGKTIIFDFYGNINYVSGTLTSSLIMNMNSSNLDAMTAVTNFSASGFFKYRIIFCCTSTGTNANGSILHRFMQGDGSSSDSVLKSTARSSSTLGVQTFNSTISNSFDVVGGVGGSNSMDIYSGRVSILN